MDRDALCRRSGKGSRWDELGEAALVGLKGRLPLGFSLSSSSPKTGASDPWPSVASSSQASPPSEQGSSPLPDGFAGRSAEGLAESVCHREGRGLSLKPKNKREAHSPAEAEGGAQKKRFCIARSTSVDRRSPSWHENSAAGLAESPERGQSRQPGDCTWDSSISFQRAALPFTGVSVSGVSEKRRKFAFFSEEPTDAFAGCAWLAARCSLLFPQHLLNPPRHFLDFSFSSLRAAVFHCLQDLRAQCRGRASAFSASSSPSPLSCPGFVPALTAFSPRATSASLREGEASSAGTALPRDRFLSVHVANVLGARGPSDLRPYVAVFGACVVRGILPRDAGAQARDLMFLGLAQIETSHYCVFTRAACEEFCRVLVTLQRSARLLRRTLRYLTLKERAVSAAFEGGAVSPAVAAPPRSSRKGGEKGLVSSAEDPAAKQESALLPDEAPALSDALLVDLWLRAGRALSAGGGGGDCGSRNSPASTRPPPTALARQHFLQTKRIVAAHLRALKRVVPSWAARDNAYEFHLGEVLCASNFEALLPYLLVFSALQPDADGRLPVSAASLSECLRELQELQRVAGAPGVTGPSQTEVAQALSVFAARRFAETPGGAAPAVRKMSVRGASTPRGSARGANAAAAASLLESELEANLQKLAGRCQKAALSSLASVASLRGRPLRAPPVASGGGLRELAAFEDDDFAEKAYARELLSLVEGSAQGLSEPLQAALWNELRRIASLWNGESGAVAVKPEALRGRASPPSLSTQETQTAASSTRAPQSVSFGRRGT